MKKVVVLGSTGSIGCSTLDVIRKNSDKYEITGLSAGSNSEMLLAQAEEFGVDILALSSQADIAACSRQILFGEKAAAKIVGMTSPDIVVNGISGAAGFLPSLEAIRQGGLLALANKESLVIGGKFIAEELQKNRARIVPVDSEHSAIFQCLAGETDNEIKRIILTASGGPLNSWRRNGQGVSAGTGDLNLDHVSSST